MLLNEQCIWVAHASELITMGRAPQPWVSKASELIKVGEAHQTRINFAKPKKLLGFDSSGGYQNGQSTSNKQ
jgi:hypothetical protein